MKSLFGALPLVLIATASASALERSAVAMDERSVDDWAAGLTCTTTYYNTCTGWLWTWSGFEAGETVGMVLESCALDLDYLISTTLYAWSGAPSDYGFTGTASLHVRDPSDCPAGLIFSQPLLPVTGFNTIQWGGIPLNDGAVVTYTHSESPLPQPIVWPSDHPAAGPTGPAACGLCYPTERVTHSFTYGTTTSPLCPGSPLDDGICHAEWFLWSAAYLSGIDYVEPRSWARVKHLFR